MGLYKYYPIPSDRMGALWTLLPIKGSCILEFGTSGTTRFELNNFARMQGEQHSEIYSTHLDEGDIAMGDMRRFDKALEEVIEKKKPPVIFVMPSTLSAVMGTDVGAYCKEYAQRYKDTKILAIRNDGFKGSWNLGVKDTLEALAVNLPKEAKRSEGVTFNIIGSCADDFNYHSDSYEVKRILKEGFNAEPICIMTSHTHISDIEAMGAAHINIVLRSEGIEAAKALEKCFGTPYVFGRPYGVKGTLAWIEKISEALKAPYNQNFIKLEIDEIERALEIIKEYGINYSRFSIALGGHIDVVKGIRSFLREEIGFKIADAWCNCPNMAAEDIPFYGESKWEEVVKNGQYNILMGNAVALKLAQDKCKKVQIDLPNYDFNPLSYPYTPYMGFRGALYLLNKCINN